MYSLGKFGRKRVEGKKPQNAQHVLKYCAMEKFTIPIPWWNSISRLTAPISSMADHAARTNIENLLNVVGRSYLGHFFL
jgi:hypothetical protein